MTAKWRTAWRAIAATLAVFAVLTAIGGFGAPAFASYYDLEPGYTDKFIAHFRQDLLVAAAVYGGMIVLHWLAAAILCRGDTHSRLAASLLGIAWLLILLCYAHAAFNLPTDWLAFLCPEQSDPNPYVLDGGPEPCIRFIVAIILVPLPLLLIALSAVVRIIGSRIEPVYG